MDTGEPGAPPPLRVLQFLGSLFFTAFFLLWTFCYGIFFTLVSLLLPFRARFALARVWAHVILAVLRWTCRLDYRVDDAVVEPASPAQHRQDHVGPHARQCEASAEGQQQ